MNIHEVKAAATLAHGLSSACFACALTEHSSGLAVGAVPAIGPAEYVSERIDTIPIITGLGNGSRGVWRKAGSHVGWGARSTQDGPDSTSVACHCQQVHLLWD